MLRREKCAGDVDGEDPVPLVKRRGLDRFLDLDTGGVHEDVESAVGVAHLGEAGHDSSLVGDVEGKEGAGGRIATDTAAVAQITGIDDGAFGLEAFADRPSDTAASTGDDGDPIIEHSHRGFLSTVGR